MEIELFKHQFDAINKVWGNPSIGLYMDLGLGKTITSIVLALMYDNPKTLIVCPKALIEGWKETLATRFPTVKFCDLRKEKILDFEQFGIINYDMLIRNNEFLKMRDYTLILDESSKICHETTKRARFVMKLKYKNLIMLSGSPCAGGKYELFYSQAKLLGIKMNKKQWWDKFVKYHYGDFGTGNFIKIIDGYKNTDMMMDLLVEHGAVFVKSDDVINLPEQIDTIVNVPCMKEYNQFLKKRVITIDGKEYVGDNTLSTRLYARMMCAHLNKAKLDAVETLLADTDERVIIFYSFINDYDALLKICEKLDKPVSMVNGSEKDLTNYETRENSVTLCQTQSASYGLNLQKANKLIYFSIGESADGYIQSLGRIRRIGQKKTCYYYYLICEDSVENDILNAVKNGNDYNNNLFKKYLERCKL